MIICARNSAKRVTKRYGYCQSLILSDEVAHTMKTHNKVLNSPSFTMADEARVAKGKESTVSAIGASDDDEEGVNAIPDKRQGFGGKGKGPKGKSDRCFICGSSEHWMRDGKANKSKSVQQNLGQRVINLLQGDDEEELINALRLQKTPSMHRNQQKRE